METLFRTRLWRTSLFRKQRMPRCFGQNAPTARISEAIRGKPTTLECGIEQLRVGSRALFREAVTQGGLHLGRFEDWTGHPIQNFTSGLSAFGTSRDAVPTNPKLICTARSASGF